jgi:septum formation protein
MADGPKLILASASPRRQSLLKEAGYDFAVHPAEVDESNVPAGLTPSDLARHLANIKADVIASKFPDAVVLGADTVVAFGERILGKPEHAADARRMLELLSGTTHIVITGVAVLCAGRGFSRVARAMSAVRMKSLSDKEISKYVAGGDWQGKAGGYGIQDPDPFVTRVSGSQSNVVGLPMKLTKSLLAEAGIPPPATPPR